MTLRWLQHQVEEGKQPQVVELSGNQLSPRMRGELGGMGVAWVGVSEQRYGRNPTRGADQRLRGHEKRLLVRAQEITRPAAPRQTL